MSSWSISFNILFIKLVDNNFPLRNLNTGREASIFNSLSATFLHLIHASKGHIIFDLDWSSSTDTNFLDRVSFGHSNFTSICPSALTPEVQVTLEPNKSFSLNVFTDDDSNSPHLNDPANAQVATHQ